MKKRTLKTVKDFLTFRLKVGGKLLLGLSGGPDSLALFHLLLECRPFLDFQLHVAHIDHGWRKESKQEAETLQRLVTYQRLPFHLKTLSHVPEADRENWCRNERLKFFSALHAEHYFQAILLAHHADDQAETLLKRICEGASLRGLGGLLEERTLNQLPIWRPLLSLRKKELEDYVQSKRLQPFQDSTNADSSYLRARIRQQIFPHLEEQFGKQIGKNFVKFGSLFQEMREYFDEKAASFEPYLTRGSFGDHLDLSPGFHPLELKCFLQKYAQENKAHLTHDACRLLLRLIERKRSSHRIEAPPLTFIVNRFHLFMIPGSFPDFFADQSQWKRVKKGSWINFWKGEVAYPKDYESTICLDQLDAVLKKKMKKWYSSHRVPPFLQSRAPLFIKRGQLIGECLTGKPLKKELKVFL